MSAPELDPASAVAHVSTGIERLRELERSRVVGADVIAVVDVPSFDSAGMDGYATAALVGVLV